MKLQIKLFLLAICISFAGSVSAAISVVAANASTTGSTASTTLSITPLASATRADVMLMQLTMDNANTGITGIGAGWTEISAIAQNTTGLQQRVYYKVRSNTEPASYTWTFASAVRATLILLDTRGVDTSVPINAYSSGTSSGNSITAPEVAAQTANSLLVGFFASASSASAISISSGSMAIPTNGTATAGTGVIAALATETYATSGLTGIRTATASNAANIGQMVALTAANTPTCFADNFNRSSLGSDWVTSNSKGGFNPLINASTKRLQLTQNTGNQATLAILQRLFPAAGNLVQVTYQHYAYPNSSGADGMVTIFSDAKVNPAAGGSGGSLGYAQYSSPANTPGFAGGWLGVGLDEFGNFSNATENRYLGIGAKANSVTIRGPSNSFYTSGTASTYTSGYPYLTSANNLSPGLSSSASVASGGGPGDYFRISIDSRVPGEQWIQVERSTDGVNYSTPVSYFNLMAALQTVFGAGTQLPSIPTNFWLSFTGGTGGSTNIHELSNLQVCATRMVAASPVIDHFRFEIPTSMNTCQSAPIKVTACTAASPSCAPLTGTDAFVTLKPTGWVGGDSVTLINGQATLQLSQTTSGTITPDIDRTKAIFPSMVNSSTASDCVAPGGTNTTSTIPCSIVVSQSTSGFGVTFPTASFPSCTDSGLVTIKACNASYASTTKNLQYWFNYTDPSTGTLPVTLSTDSWATTKTLNTATPSSATNPATISATFNSSAQTTLRIKYSDVGRITLNVRDSAATSVVGSAPVVVAPAGFSITAVKDSLGNANPSAADATGSKFVAAGSSFLVTAQALNGCATPTATPNFGQESVKEGIVLTQSVPTGLNLVDNPTLTVVNDFSFTNGVGTATISWPEAGILQLTPNLKSGNYMGTVNVTGTKSANIGRFYADHFDVAANNTCNSFTYDRQPFTGFTVTAKSADGKTLLNYAGNSSNPALNFARAVTLTDSTSSGTMPQVAASNFTGSGIASLSGSAATYTFTANPNAPVIASIGAADADNSASTGARASMLIRSGRVRMSNAYGSELLDLTIPMWSEYYNGSYWTKNTADTCTALQSPYVVFSGTNATLQANTCVWDSGNPGASGKGCAVAASGSKANRKFLQGGVTGTDSSGVAGFAGNFNVWLKAPGAGNTGGSNKTMTVTATVPTWLKYNWGSGVASPSAQASFNTYKSPLIYSRENY